MRSTRGTWRSVARRRSPWATPITVRSSRSGAFVLTATTQIIAPDALRSQAELLRDHLRPATGLPLAIAGSAGGPRITLGIDASLARLGDEGYRLAVTPEDVSIRAPRAA